MVPCLIFEQSELHLHPKVQSRLADLFLSIILSGKQCIIETHSEYIIHRLRLRAVQRFEDKIITDNLKIYFANNVDGQSQFQEIIVNEFGVILNWPEGFFDQRNDEAESLIIPAMRKQNYKKNSSQTN